MTEELFAPVLTAYVYDDGAWPDTLRLVGRSSEYGSPAPCSRVTRTRSPCYVNEKPTGAAVGQQLFGGARASGTNDKAGTVCNLIRFASPRSVKRTHRPDRSAPCRQG